MNVEKLREAEALFLRTYPGGFQHPAMQAVGKKHRMGQMVAMAQEHFAADRFEDAGRIAESMVATVGKSSMVSLFEKPKFRDTVRAMGRKNLESLANGLKNFLHGDQQEGFRELVATLRPFKLAKWSLVTVVPAYVKPDDEVFIKPTTAKGVIQHFELQGLVYKPQPTWAFYAGYREAILQMRSLVDRSLAPSIAAFGGFLMMSLEGSRRRKGPPGTV